MCSLGHHLQRPYSAAPLLGNVAILDMKNFLETLFFGVLSV